jgi:hemolysin D
MVETEKKIDTLEGQLVKVRKKLEFHNLYSPVDGIVNQLDVTTIGEVVESAKSIINIVPDNALVSEVAVLNMDICFIKKGQKAEIKLDTFSFQKYGVIEGEIVNISPDALYNQKNGELIYSVQIKPDRSTIDVNGRVVALVPGMSLSAEVKTGTRRIIEFFLDPVSKFSDESFKLR